MINKPDTNRKISTHLAFTIILILSFLLSWYAIAEGRKITNGAKNSSAFNISKRMQINNLSD